ncbi:uncharacterized protein TNCV_2766781 [Trichonephila clavipes]|nr:uncharacterized protein TNCV_2766781 [Trichonephila clavipes]
MGKADVRKGLEDGLAMRLPLSEPRVVYKDKLETDNRSNIGSEFNFEIDLPGKRDRSTIYRLNLIKLYRRKPELANLVMENSSEGIDSETLYSVKLFMDFGFQGNLRKKSGENGREEKGRRREERERVGDGKREEKEAERERSPPCMEKGLSPGLE